MKIFYIATVVSCLGVQAAAAQSLKCQVDALQLFIDTKPETLAAVHQHCAAGETIKVPLHSETAMRLCDMGKTIQPMPVGGPYADIMDAALCALAPEKSGKPKKAAH